MKSKHFLLAAIALAILFVAADVSAAQNFLSNPDLVGGVLTANVAAAALPEAIKAQLDRISAEAKDKVEELNKAFNDFKAEHGKQLEEVKKGNADALQALKVDAINAEIDRLQKSVDDANTKIASAQMGGATTGNLADAEYTSAFAAHFKKGDVQASLNKGAAAEGGYLAPIEWDRTITDKLLLVSPIRQLASVQVISGPGFSKLFNLHGTASGWVGETAARPQTNTPTFGSLNYVPGEIYANPAATQAMLDDSAVDLESWLANEVELEFSKQEGTAFVSGDGTNKPNGILTYVTGGANAAVHPFGAITVTASGAVGAITADAIIDLIYSLPAAFQANAAFAMNRATIAAVRKLKDGQNNHLWQPSYIAGQPSTLCGYPVYEVPDMPNVATGAKSILFGDFKRGYLIVDRTGTRVLRDPYTNKPYVQFYVTKRVGGGVLNPEALKAINVG